MNKIYLWGIIVTAIMLASTYYTLVITAGDSDKSLAEILSNDVVNALTMAGAAAIVLITVFVVIKYVRQMQEDTADGQLADDSWDGIGEYLNPIPRGWGILFLLTMVWAMWYWIFAYPPNSYSQIGEYNEDVAAHNLKFEEEYKSITGDRLVEMGESVFLAECKVCHGLTADGVDGTAADLNVRLEEKTVKYVILHGSNNKLMGSENPMPDRNGIMNANTDYSPISDAEIDEVAKYVANGMTGEGAETFAGACASCHGADGKGMEYVAPNIATYTPELVINVLNHGKKGVIGGMPAFDRLNAKQKEAVGAYVSSLSQ